MIIRAAFWIGLVSLMTPHEPNLGLGRPGAGATLPSPVPPAPASGLSRASEACGLPACAGALALASALTESNGRGIEDVRAEIEAAIKARAEKS